MNGMNSMSTSLQNILDQNSLKWIFVGGKGGVGKTTTSCSLAVQLAKRRRNVLIISTDPAHNISDAFNQKFTKTPTKVNGFDNLSAMEIDGSSAGESLSNITPPASTSKPEGDSMGNLLKEMASGLPGIDEASSFSQMIKLVESLDFDVVLFDTAPTGHTLRLLQFPTLIEKSLTKLMTIKSKFLPFISQLGPMLGVEELNEDQTNHKMDETLKLVRQINEEFKSPEKTTFVCVCVAEFLSMYETERLVQALTKKGIDVHNIVVNQLIYPDRNEKGEITCKKCAFRYANQKKYLTQIEDLYDEFNITKLPLLDNEVRGVDNIREFSERLAHPTENP